MLKRVDEHLLPTQLAFDFPCGLAVARDSAEVALGLIRLVVGLRVQLDGQVGQFVLELSSF